MSDPEDRGTEGTLALVSLAERPDLREAMNAHNRAAWPELMFHDPVANRLWGNLYEHFAGFQLLLLEPGGRPCAAANSAPLRWDGTDADLPAGWDDQFERTVADRAAGREPDTLGALQIVVAGSRRGDRLGGRMLGALRSLAGERGFRALIACVRPTLKDRYPTIPIERYAGWTRDDGLPFDPWIRLHARLGGRIARAAPRSMTIPGSVQEWEKWAGMAFPGSGDYVVPGAAAPVRMDREAGTGVYHDPNVWMVHALGR
ncbi:MAG: GNAT family N-acetyltransferase [Candidatus Eisenbacteria bacterium]|nr:GNAT family N-acetyltransferase [Candidatus Eisenbacteria bacterium]